MKMKTNTIKEKCLWLIGLFSLFPVVAFKARMFSWIALLMVILLETIFEKKRVQIDLYFALFIVFGFISTIICLTSSMGEAWKSNAVNTYKNMVIISMFMLLNRKKGRLSERLLNSFIKGLRLGCIVQMCWCYLQFVVFKLNGINITERIFRDILGTYKSETFYYSAGRLAISGLAWHPGQLVPFIVLSYCLFDNIILKSLVIGIALISTNSSCLVAAICCVGIELFLSIFDAHSYRLKTLISFLGAVVLGVAILGFSNGLANLFLERLSITIERAINLFSNSGNYVSNSTYLHARYYLGYPVILKNTGIIKSLFGIGLNNAGYPYSQVFGQYANIDVWAPESDVINIIIGGGIVYFLIFYTWLIRNAIKGKRISKKYLIVFASLIVAGIGYNNQFEWLIIIESIMYIAIEENIDLFSVCYKSSKKKEIQK